MARADKPAVIIGGIPGNSPEEAMTAAASALGDLLVSLPDGETDIRRFWVLATAYRVWDKHPDLDTVRAPQGIPDMPEYVPTGYDDFYIFKAKPGVERIDADTLYYADDAIASYALFKRLRDKGVIPQRLRFQVSLPFPEDACRLFTADARDTEILIGGYVGAMQRDVAAICAAIPHHDLLIQWDVNWETIAIEHGDVLPGQPPMAFKMKGDPMQRYRQYMSDLSSGIPAEVRLGMHLCYGDLHHRHFLDPKDLSACVLMANAAIGTAGRRFDYVHLPVPRHCDSDAFFEPLEDLRIGMTTLYVGLVHYTDGAQGSIRRLEVCKRHYDGPMGVATECGLGRRPPEQDLATLLQIHRDVADVL